MKKVLITGANSYIGMNVEKWLSQEPGQYQLETLDMMGEAWKNYDFSNYDTVFHVAGIAHADVGNVPEHVKKLYYQVNTDLAVATAELAKKSGVRQFIYMSSMIVYGGIEHITKDTQPAPANFYGDSKWKADCGVRKLEDASFKVVVLRPPMIYGRDSKGNYPVLAKIAARFPVFPKVNNKRSMLYIENLCEFIKLMIDREESGVFFPQNEKLMSTSALVQKIAQAKGHKIWVTGLLSPAVWVGRHVPGKIGALCKKAFGDSWYEASMSDYSENYRVVGMDDSIKKIEM